MQPHSKTEDETSLVLQVIALTTFMDGRTVFSIAPFHFEIGDYNFQGAWTPLLVAKTSPIHR